MAILKNVETQYKVDATYWRISSIDYNNSSKDLRISLEGYFDKDAREARATPLYCFPQIFRNILSDDDLSVAECYIKVKTLDVFLGAIDDI